MESSIICLGLLGALSLTACSGDSGTSQNFGTTEEKNAFWDESSNLKAWNVMKGSEIKLEANKRTLAGRVSFDKSGKKGLSRAGIVFDASNDGSPVDLSENSDGLCITYQSDFDVEVRLDDGDYAKSSVDADLPFASFTTKEDGKESYCVTWKDFTKKDSDSDGSSFAKKVRSVQIVFVGESGSSGEFDIQRLAPYVRWEMWWSKIDGDHVKTGFDEGDEGTAGEWTYFGDSSKAYIEFGYGGAFEPTDGGYDGNVIFTGSSSNPDVGLQFLVAGKSTKNGKEVIHSADVSEKWKGICIEYESMMDIEMQLVPENASEDDILKLTFAKNDDVEDMSLSSDDDSKSASHMENKCYEFANVPNSDKVLKKLTTVRLKFVKENNSGTLFTVNRISYLMPENLAVNIVGDKKDVKPTESSDHKSGKSFLWNGAKDGDHANLGISGATAGGIWTNTFEADEIFNYNFPDDVEYDEDGNAIPSLVSKYHEFTMYVKTDEGSIDLDSIASIGFNTVSSNMEAADISAWGGFCIHYSTYNYIRIVIVTDYDANKYWYADVDYSDDKVWGKVSWDAFKNIDEESNEKIEDVVGKVTRVQLQFLTDGENIIDRFGSYDQCGE